MNRDTPDAPRTPQPQDSPGAGNGAANNAMDDAAVRLAELLMIKPKWRGWIHTVTAPLALAAGIVLVVLAPTADRKITSAIYAATGVLLFGVSAVYHRGNWSPGVKIVLKRLDHTNIMLVIAGSYTPLAWTLLERPQAVLLLWVIWSGAILGVLFRLL
jgi:hemolysin III